MCLTKTIGTREMFGEPSLAELVREATLDMTKPPRIWVEGASLTVVSHLWGRVAAVVAMILGTVARVDVTDREGLSTLIKWLVAEPR